MSYLGAATNIVGGELQGWAAVLEKQAMKDAYQQEINKQNQFQQQAMGTFDPSKSSAAAMMQGVGQGAQGRVRAYNQIGQVPLGPGPSHQIGQPQINLGSADAYTKMLGQSRANLGGYSDWAVQQAINNLNTQRQLDQISNFAGSEAKNIYPLQMYKAQHSLDDLAMVGQAISSIGGGAANYAQLSQAPTQAPGYYPVYSGNQMSPAIWSGYGGYGNMPPQGTGYNPYTDQSTAPGVMSGYGF